jgi:hypothetical protein
MTTTTTATTRNNDDTEDNGGDVNRDNDEDGGGDGQDEGEDEDDRSLGGFDQPGTAELSREVGEDGLQDEEAVGHRWIAREFELLDLGQEARVRKLGHLILRSGGRHGAWQLVLWGISSSAHSHAAGTTKHQDWASLNGTARLTHR